MKKKVFYVGLGNIFLKGECIVSFRTLNNNAVECVIESRPYDTLYRLKPVETHRFYDYKKPYFIQVRRVKGIKN